MPIAIQNALSQRITPSFMPLSLKTIISIAIQGTKSVITTAATKICNGVILLTLAISKSPAEAKSRLIKPIIKTLENSPGKCNKMLSQMVAGEETVVDISALRYDRFRSEK